MSKFIACTKTLLFVRCNFDFEVVMALKIVETLKNK